MLKRARFSRAVPGAVVCACLLAAGAVDAQSPSAPPRINLTQTASGRPSLALTRIAESEAPEINADLSDAAWAKAAVIDDFVQIEPVNGAPVSERTVVRIMYDNNNLYIGVYCYDRDPDKIIANVKARDGGQLKDDFIRFNLDPTKTRRDAYTFEMNALGGRTDALVQNITGFAANWDIIWKGTSQIVADGWIVEIAIPFRNLSFDAASTEWGFDIMRKIQRKSELSRWGRMPLGTLMNDLALEGALTGLHDLNQGAGLDIQAYAGVRYKHQSHGSDDNDIGLRGSGNAYYKITPGLTGTLTLNTDFSDAPMDKRQVNTTRFSLFEDETRQFFLQDSASFEFGGRSFGLNEQNGRAFFSRNIGLVSGRPTPIIAGGKLSGAYGDIGIGGLSVLTDGTDTTDGQQLSVARMTLPLFDDNKLGVIATNGDPTGQTDNTLLGADFQFRGADVLGAGNRIYADAFYERTLSSAVGDDDAYGGAIVFPNEPWAGEIHFKTIGAAFMPALGVVNRANIRDLHGKASYRERLPDSYFRWVEAGVTATRIAGLDDNVVRSRETGAWVAGYNTAGDQLTVTVLNTYEAPFAPFRLPKGLVIPAGRYEWSHISPKLVTSFARPLTVTWETDCCTYYNGDYLKSDLTLDYRPNDTFGIVLQHVMTVLHMPAGHVNIHIIALEPVVNFTPNMEWRTQIQYDNITQRVGVLSRFRWEYTPESELFVSIGESALLQGPVFGPYYKSTNTQALVRLGQTFQF